MDDFNIFREGLATTYPGYGHALREPDPGGLYNTVAVGDVGFIREGYFHFLFNALRPPSDTDGPEYPPQLQPKQMHHIRTNRENQKYFCSKNVINVSSDPEIHASG
jgi:hypothetical protein